MTEYKGNRWFKCDLHLHTTASKCFQDQNVTPKQWVDRTIEQGLDCVAITDHNTGLSIDEIKKAAEGTGLTVFPGVEITCDTSKIHLLILFDVTKTTKDIEHFLVRADIKSIDFGEQNAHTTKSVFEISELAQKDGALIIPAHIDEYNGLGSLSVDNLKNFYSLENINAVQVVHKVFTDKNLQTIGNSELKEHLNNYYSLPKPSIDDSTVKEWFTPVKYAYENNLAILTFSDNPHEPNNSKHGLHGIGMRYTWIKMDENPSIEGLRQAFLLPKFRIKNDFESIQKPNTIPSLWIKSIKIYNTAITKKDVPFVIEFNPQLNSIIGGRGSGKSSILRFIRGIFNKTDDILSINDIITDHTDFYKKANGRPRKGVFNDESSIEVEFFRNEFLFKAVANNITSSNQQDVVVEKYNNDANNWEVIDDEGFISLFSFEHYSQKQIYEIAQDPNALRKIIDRTLDDIGRLKNEKEHIKNQFLEKSASIRTVDQIIKDKGLTETKINDLNARIQLLHQSGIAKLITSKEKYTNEKRVIQYQIDQLSEKENLIENLISQFTVNNVDLTAFDNEHRNELELLNNRITEEFAYMIKEFKAKKQKVSEIKSEYISGVKISKWNTDFEKNIEDFKNKKEELASKGINDIENFEKLTDEKLKLENDLKNINENVIKKDTYIKEKAQLKKEYLNKCKELSTKRNEFLEKHFNDNKVKINIKSFRDRIDFENKLRNIINPTDNRGSYFESDIDYLIKTCFEGHFEQKIESLRDIFRNLKNGEYVENISGHFKNLIQTLNDAQIDEIEILLPEDEIEVQYKPEGSNKFKSLSTASAGQKTTAILTFILSQGDNPLILDQPEDDIDNRHVYELIVERLRQSKEKRQIIVVTHNANIPVNGDAEYIISLNSESKYLEVLHSGTVEQANIKKEICDVMEGTEKAFQMRSSRYKFIG